MARLKLTSQNRIRLAGFSMAERGLLTVDPNRRWKVLGNLHTGTTFSIEPVRPDEESSMRLVLGQDETLVVPNGPDVLQMWQHGYFETAIIADVIVCWVYVREAISEEHLAYFKLKPDKAMTDPKQMRIFDELGPPPRLQPDRRF